MNHETHEEETNSIGSSKTFFRLFSAFFMYFMTSCFPVKKRGIAQDVT